jgi:N-acetylglucosamine-6-phosphate deacetylase
VIPVIEIKDAKDAQPLGQALLDGGLPCAEITFRTPEAAQALRHMSRFPDILLGAGTVLNVETAQAAIDAGASHATHFYDVFPAPEEYEPGARPVGAVETILADPRASVDFIADGVHVHPVAIKAALAAKGYRRLALITDANIGAGLPAGEYDTPWGFRVRVRPGDGARITGDHPSAGALAGSALTMNAGLANLLQWLDLPPARVWSMATENPARLLGLPEKGILREGADADLVLWDGELTPIGTWVAGTRVYEKVESGVN